MPTTDTPAVDIRGLVKRFGRVTAVDGLDMTIATGQIHGFLGPNGAGKSTTIRALLGLYRIDAGTIRVFGKDPSRQAGEINANIGYVPGDVALWPHLTGGQVLDALASLRGRRNREREAELIERFELDPSKKVRTYSKGNRQKVSLIAALAAPTSLLVLDEPTSGLDPLMDEVFTDVVRQAAADGQTVLMSSHILAEVQRLCDAVTIVKDGRVVEQGNLADLRRLAATRVTVRGDSRILAAAVEDLRPLCIGVELSEPGSRLVAQVEAERVAAVLGVVSRHDLADVTCQSASLDDLFLRHYRQES
ncbi:MAG: ABC transporter ATP-binding protein [Actinomycetaceae bacterium]|nr:ABC transporter ATP-binding protein [Actinomycetaceae bacterium]